MAMGTVRAPQRLIRTGREFLPNEKSGIPTPCGRLRFGAIQNCQFWASPRTAIGWFYEDCEDKQGIVSRMYIFWRDPTRSCFHGDSAAALQGWQPQMPKDGHL